MIERMRMASAFVIVMAVFAQTDSTLFAQTSPTVVTPTKKVALFNRKNLDGWYTWLQDDRYADPKHVFTVRDGMLKISGEEWGGLTTHVAYGNYHLIAEWKWGGPNLGKREGHARDSGILVHGTGEDGAHQGIWLQTIESQIIEGGTGDFIMVEGKDRPTMTAKVRQLGREFYWDEKGEPHTLDHGRFDWFGRDPNWKDQLGYHGPKDVDKPVGEWNRQEVIADGDTLTNVINGVIVNKGYDVHPAAGKIQIQSEGAEIYFRRIELMPIDRQQRSAR